MEVIHLTLFLMRLTHSTVKKALDGRKLVAVRLAGDHTPMQIGISTLAQERKPMILTVFEQHCRNMISDAGIPGMTTGDSNGT